jgi:hypothetical protein
MFPGKQRLGGRAYSVVRFLVRLLAVVLILVMGAFVFLRLYGVPGPLLREVVRRFNASGIPVDVASVRLTFRGWSATDVRYYSRHPDDLKPIIHSDEVLFKRVILPGSSSADGVVFDVAARGIVLTPSAEWGVEFPPESALGIIDSAQVSVSFLPERIRLSNGTLNWKGIDFHVEGDFLRKAPMKKPPDVKEPDVPSEAPALVTADQIRKVERWLKSLQLNGTAEADIKFTVDAGRFSRSKLVCTSLINDFVFRDVAFSRAETAFEYAYPEANLKQASLFKDNQQFRIEGNYALDTQLANVSVSNRILSRRMLLLLPQRVLNLLTGIRLGFTTMPTGDLSFGPAVPAELLNRVSGTLSVHNARYGNLEIEALSGRVRREGHRLECDGLKGTVGGQEDRKDETGSCMVGGNVEGSMFWDSAAHEYGVEAEGSIDPNLLVESLSFSRVATNVIRGFRFKEQPPHVYIDLGQNYSRRNTFFINVQASAFDVFVRDVPFTSVNTTVAYKQKVVKIDPVTANQGTEYIRGSAVLDYNEGLASFDAMSSVSPEALEDVIYPRVDLFGNKIKTAGKTKITARGCVDWRRMQATDFEAEVEIGQCRIPAGLLDGLNATVTGRGPEIRLRDAVFNICDGRGSGDFSVRVDPLRKGFPYTLDTSLSEVDFRKYVQFFLPDEDLSISGNMSGEARIESDFSKDFFKTANGSGSGYVIDGQLADLPLFRGFSKVMRKVIPSFSIFSINDLSGNFEIKEGVFYSDNAYFDGSILSAKGQGSYSVESGFDAYFQAQVFSENRMSKVLRFITDPFFKLFELKLEGSLADPSWKVDKFSIKFGGDASPD